MFDEDDDRDGLLIDEHEQSSTELEKPKLSPTENRVNFTPPDFAENGTSFHKTNGIAEMTGLNSSREEGELEDDEMDTSAAPSPAKKPVEVKVTTPVNDRKRVNGDSEISSSETDTAVKRCKVETSEKGTCVHSEASQAEVDESIFDVEAGSSFPLQITVVCRLEGTDTLYFSTKWKDRELSGLLTDGEPPGFANFAKKRIALNNNSQSESEKAGITGTPKKRVRGQDTKKKKPDEEDDDLDVTGLGDTRDSNSSSGSIKLVEVNSVSLHYCPNEGCGHAYPSSNEMEYHISTVHKKKSVIYEHNSSQTQTEGVHKTMASVSTDTQGLLLEEKSRDEKKDLNGDLSEAQPGSHLSDISDDIAPVLLKEEPRTTEATTANGVVSYPSTSSNSTALRTEKTTTPQSAIVQPTQVVPPIAASPRASNGLLIPAATFVSPFSVPTSSAVSTPSARASSATTVTESTPKQVASPARQGFHPLMQQGAGPSQQQLPPQMAAAQAQMMQAAQLQHMHSLMQLQIMQGGRQFPMGMSSHDLAALQALQQAGNFPMYPKH